MPDAHRLSEWHLTSEAITAPRLSGLRGIALSTVVVACALVPRLWLHGVLEDRSTFILFTLAVMVSVRFGGDWPARSQRGSAVGLGITWLAQQLRAAKLRAEEALEQVRTLTGLLPICAWCKKIRDEEGRWQQLERYISLHSDAKFTHGLCEECERRLEADRQALNLKGA